MESAGRVREVPPRKTLREGQREVVAAVVNRREGRLNVQLPTGYGKTLTSAAAFVELRKAGVVNRLLYLVPTSAQLDQFTRDGSDDFLDAGLAGVEPFDVGYSPALGLKRHRSNETIVFAATIQAVASGAAGMAVSEMLSTGRWMIVIDEYHHYGIDKTWGRAILGMNAAFVLAMSATPDRKNQDSALGAPDVRVTYREAVEQGAAKRLELHSYEYRIDAISINDNAVVSFTTSDLAAEVGSDEPSAVDRFMVERKLRWSPKYVSPLVSVPVERLLRRRVATGLPLQMIVGAMGCLHAQMVCEQIRSMFDFLRVDWVGTGEHGRRPEQNAEIIRKFCPKKVNGKRRPKDVGLDILVHVGMAGEGLDSVYVCEVVHLNPANVNNQNDQENGRAARTIPGADVSQQWGVINVDSSSPYAEKWCGRAIMDAFDRQNGEPAPDMEEPSDSEMESERSLADLPDDPVVVIADCELQHIDKGDPEVIACAETIAKLTGTPLEAMSDPDHVLWERALQLRQRELRERGSGLDAMSRLTQLRDQIGKATSTVALKVARLLGGGRFEKGMIGDIKKRLFSQRKRISRVSVTEADEQQLRSHFAWLSDLDKEIGESGVPPWLR